MKYLRLFQTHAQHEQERKELEKLELYTSYCEDNDEVTIFCKKKSKYAVGDYLLSSGEVIKNADYVDQDVIGVCVIPDNFISKTGINSKARFCALTGIREKYRTDWVEDTGLPMFDKIGCVGEYGSEDENNWAPTNTLDHNNDYGRMPCQISYFEKTVENPYDPETYWYYNNGNPNIASPYLYVNGEYVFNEGVYNGCVDNQVSMLSDMDGLANTTIINDSDHPAAQYCTAYSTNGTTQGDWYLPAIGEVAFILARFDTIQNAISKVSGNPFGNSEAFWSSTQYSVQEAQIASSMQGSIERDYKTSNCYVIPFIRLD